MATLIADAGGTSVSWATVARHQPEFLPSTAGINPVVMTTDEISAVVNSLQIDPAATIDKIYFYGAGCRDEATCGRVESALRQRFPAAAIHVDSDLAGAAMALFGHQPGIACILGTGANAGVWNGSEIIAKPASLGFILGDEGSGAAIGKRFIHDYFNLKLSSEAMQAIARSSRAEELASLSGIIDRVYRQPAPNAYLASFSRLIGENRHISSLISIVDREFELFADGMLSQTRQLAQAEGYPNLPVGFVGSIAHHFADRLNAAIGPCSVISSPLEAMTKFF